MASRHPHADLPIDTSVVIPEAVRRMAEQADAIQAQMTGVPTPPENAPAPPTSLDAPPAPTNANPGDFVPPPVIQEAPPPEAPPEAPPTQNAQPEQIVEPPPAPPGSPEAKWEHAYKSVKGRFDHLTASTNRTIQGLNQRISELETIARAPAPTPQPAPTAPTGVPPDFSPEDIETWGPDMLAMVDRVVSARAAKITGQVEERIGQVQQHVEQRAQEDLVAYMDRTFPAPAAGQAPVWRTTNTDQNFLAWLNLRDDLSGRIRGELLTDAFKRNDGPRVAAFFRSFISEAPSAPAVAPATQEPAASPSRTPPSNRMSLTALAAPGGARPAATPPAAPVEKRLWKTSDIAKFYDALHKGQFSGRDAQAKAYEEDIFAAQAEGRVMEG